MATVNPIAAAASTREATTPARYGRRKDNSRQKVRITSKSIVARLPARNRDTPCWRHARVPRGVLRDEDRRGFPEGHARSRRDGGGARQSARRRADHDRRAGGARPAGRDERP